MLEFQLTDLVTVKVCYRIRHLANLHGNIVFVKLDSSVSAEIHAYSVEPFVEVTPVRHPSGKSHFVECPCSTNSPL